MVSPDGFRLITLIVHELARCHPNARAPLQISLWGLLPLRFVLSLFVVMIENHVSNQSNIGFLALGTVLTLAAYMPETRGRSLESIQEEFHQRPVMQSWMHHLRRLVSRKSARGASVAPNESIELSSISHERRTGESSTRGMRFGLASA